ICGSVRQAPHRNVKESARRTASIFVSATILTVAACASSQGRAAIARPASATPSSATIQAMYESGEDREIVNRVKNGVRTDVTGADRWFAAQSQLRLGLRNDAISDLTALTQTACERAL